MDTNTKQYSLTEGQLAGLLADPRYTKNALGLQVKVQAAEKVEKDSMDSGLEKALGMLCAPAKSIVLHYTTGDAQVGRLQLAEEAGAPGSYNPEMQLANLYRTGNLRRLTMITADELRLFTCELLAVNNLYRQNNQYLELSAQGVIAFLAVAAHYKYANALALVNHSLPESIFTVSQVHARLAQCAVDDFRWPLNFFNGVLPAAGLEKTAKEELALWLEELAACGFTEAVAQTQSEACYALSDAGEWIMDGLLHEVSKLALTMAQFVSDGTVGSESSLLVRTPFDLLLFNINGKAGIISTLTAAGYTAYLSACLKSAALPAAGTGTGTGTPARQTAAPVTVDACPGCGAALPPDSRFCAACGRNLEQRLCSKCAKPVTGNAKFCGNCGQKLA